MIPRGYIIVKCCYEYMARLLYYYFLNLFIIELEEDIETNDLQAMFETTFRHDMRQRLQGDKDYRPSRHPNSEEYFIKGSNSKQNRKE